MPCLIALFDLGRTFAFETGLASPKVRECIDAVRGYGKASMSMLGNAVFAAGSEIEIDGRRLRAGETIELGHKLALVDIAAGETVTKFGVPIGVATVAIAAGAHVHIHNIKSVYLTNDVDHFE